MHGVVYADIGYLVILTVLQVGSSTKNFDVMVGNPLAKQILWDTNPTYLAAWKEGKTGQA